MLRQQWEDNTKVLKFRLEIESMRMQRLKNTKKSGKEHRLSRE